MWLARRALFICPGFARSFYPQEKCPASRASAPAPPSGEALRVVLCGVVPAGCAAGCPAMSQLRVLGGSLLPGAAGAGGGAGRGTAEPAF